MSEKKSPRVFWVDPGGEGFPMSVIDKPPIDWKDLVTGAEVRPEFYHRFIKCVEVLDPDKFAEFDDAST